MILIAATPLVALCDACDDKHRIAVDDLDSLIACEFRVCDAVLTEACFHLPHRTQRLRLQTLLDDLGMQPVTATNDSGFWQDVFGWLAKYADHEPDWADACLAVLSGRHPDAKVWTYDREFRTTWRRPSGTTIPLAVKIT